MYNSCYVLIWPLYHRTGHRGPISRNGHFGDAGRYYGYWPKWSITELKKVEHALSKITANFSDGHAGRRITTNIAETTSATILKSYDHKPIRTPWNASVGVTLFQCLATVGVEGKPTHAIMVRGPQGHEGKRA